MSGMDTRGNARVLNAMVPLANMFGYVNNLRSMSRGALSSLCILIITNKSPRVSLTRSVKASPSQ